jgi:hypothetical protein
MFHTIKFLFVISIKKIFKFFNFFKFLFENDFDQKKFIYHKHSFLEEKFIKILNSNLKNRTSDPRKSSEIKFGTSYKDWYKNDELYQASLEYKLTKRRHDYLKRYNFYFRQKRETVKKILEIGVDRGESLKTWSKYFPNATVYGLDIDERAKKYENEKIKIIIADQNNEDDLRKIYNQHNDFDIIVDDGSHKYEHIIKSFIHLFPILKNSGVYVVEDVINNYRLLNFFNRYVFGINFFPTNTATIKEPGYTSLDVDVQDIKDVVGISVFRHILFIEKGLNPEDNPFKNVVEKKIVY